MNSKLVSNTKSKIGALEQELAEQKQRAASGGDAPARAAPAAAAAAAAAGESETIKQLQKVLKEESEARDKAQKEAAALRQQVAASTAAAAAAAKPAGVPPEELKKLQLELREKEKQARALRGLVRGLCPWSVGEVDWVVGAVYLWDGSATILVILEIVFVPGVCHEYTIFDRPSASLATNVTRFSWEYVHEGAQSRNSPVGIDV